MDLCDIISDSIRSVINQELPELISNELKKYFDNQEKVSRNNVDNDNIGIARVKEITGYANPTIYSKVHRREIPVIGRGRPLLFSESQINLWIQAGRPKTSDMVDILNMLPAQIKPQ